MLNTITSILEKSLRMADQKKYVNQLWEAVRDNNANKLNKLISKGFEIEKLYVHLTDGTVGVDFEGQAIQSDGMKEVFECLIGYAVEQKFYDIVTIIAEAIILPSTELSKRQDYHLNKQKDDYNVNIREISFSCLEKVITVLEKDLNKSAEGVIKKIKKSLEARATNPSFSDEEELAAKEIALLTKEFEQLREKALKLQNEKTKCEQQVITAKKRLLDTQAEILEKKSELLEEQAEFQKAREDQQKDITTVTKDIEQRAPETTTLKIRIQHKDPLVIRRLERLSESDPQSIEYKIYERLSTQKPEDLTKITQLVVEVGHALVLTNSMLKALDESSFQMMRRKIEQLIIHSVTVDHRFDFNGLYSAVSNDNEKKNSKLPETCVMNLVHIILIDPELDPGKGKRLLLDKIVGSEKFLQFIQPAFQTVSCDEVLEKGVKIFGLPFLEPLLKIATPSVSYSEEELLVIKTLIDNQKLSLKLLCRRLMPRSIKIILQVATYLESTFFTGPLYEDHPLFSLNDRGVALFFLVDQGVMSSADIDNLSLFQFKMYVEICQYNVKSDQVCRCRSTYEKLPFLEKGLASSIQIKSLQEALKENKMRYINDNLLRLVPTYEALSQRELKLIEAIAYNVFFSSLTNEIFTEKVLCTMADVLIMDQRRPLSIVEGFVDVFGDTFLDAVINVYLEKMMAGKAASVNKELLTTLIKTKKLSLECLHRSDLESLKRVMMPFTSEEERLLVEQNQDETLVSPTEMVCVSAPIAGLPAIELEDSSDHQTVAVHSESPKLEISSRSETSVFSEQVEDSQKLMAIEGFVNEPSASTATESKEPQCTLAEEIHTILINNKLIEGENDESVINQLINSNKLSLDTLKQLTAEPFKEIIQLSTYLLSAAFNKSLRQGSPPFSTSQYAQRLFPLLDQGLLSLKEINILSLKPESIQYQLYAQVCEKLDYSDPAFLSTLKQTVAFLNHAYFKEANEKVFLVIQSRIKRLPESAKDEIGCLRQIQEEVRDKIINLLKMDVDIQEINKLAHKVICDEIQSHTNDSNGFVAFLKAILETLRALFCCAAPSLPTKKEGHHFFSQGTVQTIGEIERNLKTFISPQGNPS